MKKRVTKSVAKGMKAALDVVLQTEANTASCAIMYQPKAPKELMKYRRIHGIARAFDLNHSQTGKSYLL